MTDEDQDKVDRADRLQAQVEFTQTQLTEAKDKIARADRILAHWKQRGDTSNFEIAFLEQYLDHFKSLKADQAKLEVATAQLTESNRLIDLAIRMRKAQKFYFKTRQAANLDAAKDAEIAFDRALESSTLAAEIQGQLFNL